MTLAIGSCRRAALGGHVACCEDCAHRVIAYINRRNRDCPTCKPRRYRAAHSSQSLRQTRQQRPWPQAWRVERCSCAAIALFGPVGSSPKMCQPGFPQARAFCRARPFARAFRARTTKRSPVFDLHLGSAVSTRRFFAHAPECCGGRFSLRCCLDRHFIEPRSNPSERFAYGGPVAALVVNQH